MTNRTDYQDIVLPNPKTEVAELWELVNFLAEIGQSPTPANARLWLARCLDNAPGEWRLTLDRIDELWPVEIAPVLAQVKKAA